MIFFSGQQRKEPKYQGKTLSAWLKQLDDGRATLGIGWPFTRRALSREQVEAAAAIRAIGTNALPFLLTDLRAKPSRNSPAIRLREGMDWVEKRSGYRIHFPFEGLTKADAVRWRAAQGISALGPVAGSLGPELVKDVMSPSGPGIKEAAYGLAAIGPGGVYVLSNAVHKALQPGQLGMQWSGMCALWGLGEHPETASNALPFLISNVASTNQWAASGAIQVLGFIRADAEHVVPALSNALNSSDQTIRRDAAWALKEFGREDVAKPGPSVQSSTLSRPAD